MFLNMNNIRHTVLFAVSMIGLMFSSCSDDIPGNVDEPSIVNPGKSLRFGLNRNVMTRATHEVDGDWYEAQFEKDDIIGCVIYNVNDDSFVAVAEFGYSEEGFLILNHVWEKKNGSITKIGQANSTIISRLKNDDTTTGYLKLKDNGEYGFVFFYPFFNEDILLDGWNKLHHKDYQSCHIPFSMFFMPGTPDYDSWHVGQNYDRFMNAGLVSDQKEECVIENNVVVKPTAYNWKEYPAFVGVFQNSTDGKQSQYSNHMGVKCAKDPDSNKNISNKNKETLHTIDLTFKKKMAMIDVIITDPDVADDIFFRHPDGDENGDYTQNRINAKTGIIRGLKWNMLSEAEDKALDIYNHLTWDVGYGGSIENFYTDNPLQYTDKTREDFYPLKLNSTTERRWRLILPPQDNFTCYLHFKLNGKDKSIRIHDKLTELKGNHLYIIKLMPKQQWGIRIRDWEEKNQGILIED